MGGRASSFEELVPLVELCRAGKLLDVQDWIQSGQSRYRFDFLTGYSTWERLQNAVFSGVKCCSNPVRPLRGGR